jgi:uncharacterized membrane protein YphA (DoxX/SURF4 family)
MELLKLLGSLILALICIVFTFAVIEDFQWRQCMRHPWLQLAFGATIAIFSGAGAYHLY